MLWILVTVLAVVLGLFLAHYNGLVYLRQLLKNSWADVDVYLKRRAELIPNLAAAVKAYSSHESTVLEALVVARSKAMSTPEPNLERAAAEAQIKMGVVRAIALAEAYPDLKASDNFLNLQHELSDTEKLIASARQYYNAVVRDYNTKIEAFPSNIVAGIMGLKQAEFFEVDEIEEREVPSVGETANRRDGDSASED